ncbi:MAG: hypothetical protein ABSG07_15395 [Terriglobales bacterium]
MEGLRINRRQVFDCIRADEVSKSGSITRDFLLRLGQSDVVIADLSDLNPNVFYELGVRHALRPGTLILAEKGTPLPFDIRDLRVIRYEDRVGGEKDAVQAIRDMLTAVIEDPQRQDSPVLDCLADLGTARSRNSLGSLAGRVRDGKITSPITGIWLELLNRREKRKPVQHFSFFRFQYNRDSFLDPFMMTGESFRADGTWHSSWSTKYLRIKTPSNRVGTSVEYVYRADIGRGEQRCGYGVSRFLPDERNKLVTGSGYYLAGEENPPYRCDYQLLRIDVAFEEKIGARWESFGHGHLRKLIPLIQAKYGQILGRCG